MIDDVVESGCLESWVCSEIVDLRSFIRYLGEYHQETGGAYPAVKARFQSLCDAYDERSIDRILRAKDKDAVKSLSDRVRALLPDFVRVCDNDLAIDTAHFWEWSKANGFRRRQRLVEVDYTFVGRELELTQLYQHFFEHRDTNFRTQPALIHARTKKKFCVQGFGGMGKTALAIAYANRYADFYSGVLWVDCKETDFQEDIIRYAQDNGVIPYEVAQTTLDKYDYYWSVLQEKWSKPILVVFDNVETKNQRSPVQAILPNNNYVRIHVVMTSREKLFPKTAVQFELDVMVPEDAVMLFKQHCPSVDENNQSVRRLVSETLNGHPLSIAVIAAYCESVGVSDFDALNKQIATYDISGDVFSGPWALHSSYDKSVYASLDISYRSLPNECKLLLMFLSLYPRVDINRDILTECILQSMRAPGLEKKLSHDFSGSGRVSSLYQLIKHCLVQNKKSHIAIHEVIYDFLIEKWIQESRSQHLNLPSLEMSLSRISAELVGAKISRNTLTFDDAQLLSGVLMPLVIADRNYIPTISRIYFCLDFWFENYVFQQYVYDTELQETLFDRYLAMDHYLSHTEQYLQKHRVVLTKMIGHAYYSNPGDMGSKAQNALISGRQQVEPLLIQEPDNVDLIWYNIFFLDHIINTRSKSNDFIRQFTFVSDCPVLSTWIHQLEKELPKGLIGLERLPKQHYYPLLLRAAHYWGHRGNQDSFSLYRCLTQGNYELMQYAVIQECKEHYIKALNYRLASLFLFYKDEFTSTLSARLATMPKIASWITQLEPVASQVEKFATLYQGVGDSAHQYRGLHFVCVMECLVKLRSGQDCDLSSAEESFIAANTLWQLADQIRGDNEAPIKYVLWMTSSEVVLNLLRLTVKGDALPSLVSVEKEIHAAVSAIQKKLPGNYLDAAKQQFEQCFAIYGLLIKD